ncbi:SMC-Scp complex subunit ScpB [Pseudohaliea sp.]|uniref:SMC-Scp complex subunit ScpB n=1 Tax=Pseudohaliea sp. TaxID=2740289 RepID=UPI0032EC6B9D
MAETGLVQIIEGALLAAGKPLTVTQLAELFEEAERPPKEDIRAALEEVAARCEDRGFELREVASGFRFQVRQNLGPWVARLWHERPPKYSRALLETLALIAYRQPITRGEIEEIRGVAVSSNIIKTLHEREWIRVVGHRDVPGRPAMYATTRQFLDYFNLKSLDQLPALADIRDLETLNAELGFSEPLASAANDAAGSGEAGGPAAEPPSPDSAGGDVAVPGEEPATPEDAATDGDVASAGHSGAEDDSSDEDSTEDAAGAQRADG